MPLSPADRLTWAPPSSRPMLRSGTHALLAPSSTPSRDAAGHAQRHRLARLSQRALGGSGRRRRRVALGRQNCSWASTFHKSVCTPARGGHAWLAVGWGHARTILVPDLDRLPASRTGVTGCRRLQPQLPRTTSDGLSSNQHRPSASAWDVRQPNLARPPTASKRFPEACRLRSSPAPTAASQFATMSAHCSPCLVRGPLFPEECPFYPNLPPPGPALAPPPQGVLCALRHPALTLCNAVSSARHVVEASALPCIGRAGDVPAFLAASQINIQ